MAPPRTVTGDALDVWKRRKGMAGRGPCPVCGDPVVVSTLKLTDPQPGHSTVRQIFDYPPTADDDEYGNHAASLDLVVAHRISDGAPFVAGLAKRLVPHFATHPQCKPILTRRAS